MYMYHYDLGLEMESDTHSPDNCYPQYLLYSFYRVYQSKCSQSALVTRTVILCWSPATVDSCYLQGQMCTVTHTCTSLSLGGSESSLLVHLKLLSAVRDIRISLQPIQKAIRMAIIRHIFNMCN